MTTKPKAKKFRIRRSASRADDIARRVEAAAGGAPKAGDPATPRDTDDQAMPFQPAEDGFGDAPFPTAAAEAIQNHADAETEIAAIRKESLTGRQLRMARRVAQKHGLAPTSDFDAVRQLRRKGIDPFQRANALELVVSQSADGAQAEAGSVPQTIPKHNLPSTEVLTEDARAREIVKMQRDIVRRRRRKLIQLATRLAAFVMLPTFITGYYFFVIATPMFSTKSEFVIQQAQPAMGGGAAGLSSLFSGTSFATSQDSIAVQGYLGSLEAMLRLEKDVGFISHFSRSDIDPLQRLETDATKEDAHKVYKKKVKISYDPTEGIIKMEVIAADPIVSEQFSKKLIEYAEEQVDNLTQRLREDQMQGARRSFEEAEAKMFTAQQKVLELQQRVGVVNAEGEVQSLMAQVSTFETQLQEKRLQLQALLDNPRPNRARVDGARGDVRRLEGLIAELRAQLTEDTSSSASFAQIRGQLLLAETELQTRQLLMTQALQQLETARIEANRQTRYLENSVKPISPDTPSYPRAFENTILAFLIFGGIYLMISLTAAILREQVSS